MQPAAPAPSMPRLCPTHRPRLLTPSIGLMVSVLVCGLASPSPSDAHAGTVHHPTHFRQWTSDDGLPQSSVQSIARSPRGYLWLATQEGLARFDGRRFVVFDRSNTPAMESHHILRLVSGVGNEIWVLTSNEILRIREDRTIEPVLSHTALGHLEITDLAGDGSAGVWIGTTDGLYHWSGGQMHRLGVGDDLVGRVDSLAHTAEGELWLSHRGQLMRRRQGRFEPFDSPCGSRKGRVSKLEVGPEGSLWLIIGERICRRSAGAGTDNDFVRITELPEGAKTGFFDLSEDRQGRLWLASLGGLMWFDKGRWKSPVLPDQLVDSQVISLLPGPGGELWLGTMAHGLLELGSAVFSHWGSRRGLLGGMPTAVLEDRRGDLWVGTFGDGLYRQRHGADGMHLERFDHRDGLPFDTIGALLESPDGHLWIGTAGGGLARFDGRAFEVFSRREGLGSTVISALELDRRGTLWVATRGGLFRSLSEGRFEAFHIEGLPPAPRILSLLEDSRGTLWVGTLAHGLVGLRPDGSQIFTTADGLSSPTIQAIAEDPRGTLWLATQNGGLVRFRNGLFRAYTSREGLPTDTFFSVVADGHGALWLGSNQGIVRLPTEGLERFDAGRLSSVPNAIFDASHGLGGREATGGAQPAAWKGADGRLHFPTTAGIGSVDPEPSRFVLESHPMVIERVLVAGEDRSGPGAPGQPIVSRVPGTQSVEIHYSAIDFDTSGSLSFRYRLEGFEDHWVEAGERRQVYYGKLPPGRYRFLVQVVDSRDPANVSEATTELVIEPRFYQSSIFEALSILALVGALFAFHQLRLASGRRREKELSRRVSEAVEQLKILKGLLPICASCKSIRDDEGAWTELETYLQRHSEVDFSHGCCPACLREHYPEIAERLARRGVQAAVTLVH